MEAIFEDGIDQIANLAESALQQDDSWAGFVWFVEQLCELTATDRGLREMVYSKAYGGYRVECARLRLDPPITKLVERARADGHLRSDIEPTDMPIVSLLAGTVSEWAGHVEPELWRRGIGAALVEAATHQARRRGLSLTVVASPSAREFYESCGFAVEGEAQTRFGPALRMSR